MSSGEKQKPLMSLPKKKVHNSFQFPSERNKFERSRRKRK